ncbi:hypothetical protein, partial [Photobacterium aquimaris]|uniref:hypothetical protein n=1 Tax=Photobacterium aquimaris TaxID=512643 RepID=UPI0013566A96
DDLDTTQSDNIGTADVDERALGAANDGEVEDHHHKVTFHWLHILRTSGYSEKPTNVNASLEAQYGIGYVTYETLTMTTATDLVLNDLFDYQMVVHDAGYTSSATQVESADDLDVIVAYQQAGGVLITKHEGLVITGGGIFVNAYLAHQLGFSGAIANEASAYDGATDLPRFHPSASAGGLAQQPTLRTTGSLSTIRGLDHRSILYTTPVVAGSCNDVHAADWLVPWNPQSDGGYTYPRTQPGFWLGTGETTEYFSAYYGTENTDNRSGIGRYIYEYYNAPTSFEARNDWVNDPNNVHPSCSGV